MTLSPLSTPTIVYILDILLIFECCEFINKLVFKKIATILLIQYKINMGLLPTSRMCLYSPNYCSIVYP